ncbi:MAG: SUMF1/EgtB/PvdO family nonheme iron enzyme [Muribaculaceae bacterium]|nr:SUMF1/EgtB/PvdO family nonheme iron enzyme [Muribaculaceae bacterium]
MTYQIFFRSLVMLLGIILPSLSWGQGQITRPSQTTSKKSQSNKKVEPILPNSTETINGITVNWNGVTQNQKSAISCLLNNLVYVQGGSYMMGYDNSDASKDEKPVHPETVRSFRIDKFEVTQKLWQAVMGNNPSNFTGENLPVDNVSRNDCQNFIKKLNRLTGLNFRLPTEVEWEYAARGGNKSKGYKYSGGDTLNNVAWYYNNSGQTTHPVGSKSPNELGIYDMTGNVYEWTSDNYSSDYNSPRNKESYVHRGGAWISLNTASRVSQREYFFSPTTRSSFLGFRLVL